MSQYWLKIESIGFKGDDRLCSRHATAAALLYCSASAADSTAVRASAVRRDLRTAIWRAKHRCSNKKRADVVENGQLIQFFLLHKKYFCNNSKSLLSKPSEFLWKVATNKHAEQASQIHLYEHTYYILCSSQLGRNMTKFEPKDRTWVLCTIGRNILWRSCLILSTCGIFTRFLCIIHITNIQVTKFKLYNFLNSQIRLWQ